MLLSLVRQLVYDPRRHIRRLPFVDVGAGTVILGSAKFDFRLGSKSFGGRIGIGAESMIGSGFVFESNQGVVSVGDHTFINRGTKLICRESIVIGSNVTIAWGCTLYDHNSHSIDWRERANDLSRQLADVRAGRNFIHGKDWDTVKSRGIVIEDKAWLGFGVTVLNGVRIGEGSVVGAGSVVRSDVPPWTIVGGNPAVHLRNIDRS